MTIAICAANTKGIVLATDGRASRRDNGQLIELRDDLQKIFPIPGRPFAVVHIGINQFDGIDVHARMASLAPLLATKERPGHLPDLLIREFAPLVEHVWDEIVRDSTRVEFWVVGFAKQVQEPEVWVFEWGASNGMRKSPRPKNFGSKADLFGGEVTAIQIAANSLRMGNQVPRNAQVPQIQSRVRRLYKEVLRDSRNRKFGGTNRELTITRTGWEWTIGSELPDCMTAATTR